MKYLLHTFFALSLGTQMHFLYGNDDVPPPLKSTPIGYQPEIVTTEPRGLITPTVAPRVNQGYNFSIDADFIWWKAYVSDFDYARINGNLLSPDFSFQPGFKIGTGMDLYHDAWDIYTQYTWLYEPTQRNGGESLQLGYSTFAIPFAQNAQEGILSAISLSDTASWRKAQFNILDAEVGRNFFISKRLTLRPHIGAKAASFFEKTKIIYIGNGSIGTDILKLKQNMSGLGIRMGLNTLWHIIPSFGFYGDLGFTALWGSFHDNLSNQAFLEDRTIQTSFRKNSQDILPVFEISLGLSYQVWFKKERYQLYLKGGWEEQIWVGYNKNLVNGQTSADGNLTFQGLTLKAGLVF